MSKPIKVVKVSGIAAPVLGEGDRAFEQAMRKFKRLTKESGILEDVRDRQFYSSKGERAREAKKAATRRFRRAQKKEQELMVRPKK